MNLHEYQAKDLFAHYGLPVAAHGLVRQTSDITTALHQVETEQVVAKVQVHAGGRGKAGGVRLCEGAAEVADFSQRWLGQQFVSYQTDARGQKVSSILLEPRTEIQRELYFGAVIDRSLGRVVMIASDQGGVDIEQVASQSPDRMITQVIDPRVGAQAYQGREIGFRLGLNAEQVAQFSEIFVQAYRMFVECDLSLLEVNPLVVDGAGSLLCLDAKINLDSNALYRQPGLKACYDPEQMDAREANAEALGLNYIHLEGNIGCMVNGAGLAMATMDVIKLHGGAPANFLDVGGSATQARVAEAFKIILSDSQVNTILVNIFGGIVRCDLIAEGILAAVEEIGIHVPVVVRLEGNNAELGLERLDQCEANITTAKSLTQAAVCAVDLARGEQA